MPLTKKGSYHANPAIARMHDEHDVPAEAAQEHGQAVGEAHGVEIHDPNHPETGDGQNFHVRVHHPDGSMVESKHPSYKEAADHGAVEMGHANEEDDEPQDKDTEPDDDGDDNGEGSDVDDEY